MKDTIDIDACKLIDDENTKKVCVTEMNFINNSEILCDEKINSNNYLCKTIGANFSEYCNNALSENLKKKCFFNLALMKNESSFCNFTNDYERCMIRIVGEHKENDSEYNPNPFESIINFLMDLFNL